MSAEPSWTQLQAFAKTLQDGCTEQVTQSKSKKKGAVKSAPTVSDVLPACLVILKEDVVKHFKGVACTYCKHWAQLVARRLPLEPDTVGLPSTSPPDVGSVLNRTEDQRTPLDGLHSGPLTEMDLQDTATLLPRLLERMKKYVADTATIDTDANLETIFPYVHFTGDDGVAGLEQLPLLGHLSAFKANLLFDKETLGADCLAMVQAMKDADSASTAQACHSKSDTLPSQLEDRRKVLNNKVDNARRTMLRDLQKNIVDWWGGVTSAREGIESWLGKAGRLARECQAEYDAFVLEHVSSVAQFADAYDAALKAGAPEGVSPDQLFAAYEEQVERQKTLWRQTLAAMRARMVTLIETELGRVLDGAGSMEGQTAEVQALQRQLSAAIGTVRQTLHGEQASSELQLLDSTVMDLWASLRDEWATAADAPARKAKAEQKDFRKKLRRLEARLSEWRQRGTDDVKALLSHRGIHETLVLSLLVAVGQAQHRESIQALGRQELLVRSKEIADGIYTQTQQLRTQYQQCSSDGWTRLHCALGALLANQLLACCHDATVGGMAPATVVVPRQVQAEEEAASVHVQQQDAKPKKKDTQAKHQPTKPTSDSPPPTAPTAIKPPSTLETSSATAATTTNGETESKKAKKKAKQAANPTPDPTPYTGPPLSTSALPPAPNNPPTRPIQTGPVGPSFATLAAKQPPRNDPPPFIQPTPVPTHTHTPATPSMPAESPSSSVPTSTYQLPPPSVPSFPVGAPASEAPPGNMVGENINVGAGNSAGITGNIPDPLLASQVEALAAAVPAQNLALMVVQSAAEKSRLVEQYASAMDQLRHAYQRIAHLESAVTTLERNLMMASQAAAAPRPPFMPYPHPHQMPPGQDMSFMGAGMPPPPGGYGLPPHGLPPMVPPQHLPPNSMPPAFSAPIQQSPTHAESVQEGWGMKDESRMEAGGSVYVPPHARAHSQSNPPLPSAPAPTPPTSNKYTPTRGQNERDTRGEIRGEPRREPRGERERERERDTPKKQTWTRVGPAGNAEAEREKDKSNRDDAMRQWREGREAQRRESQSNVTKEEPASAPLPQINPREDEKAHGRHRHFCGNCGRSGHTSFDCTVPCRYCGKQHLAEHCPQNQRLL